MTAIKAHRRKALQLVASILLDNLVEHSITFHNSEATNLSQPHNDMLVHTLNISNYEVSKILVDNENSADVLFYVIL